MTDVSAPPTTSPDSAVRDLDELYTQSKTGRAWLEPTWILNLAYYNGDQWLAWNGRQLFQPNLRPNRITIVDNRIQGCVRTEIAKMTKNRPVFTVIPGTGDDEDVNAASLGEQVMRFLWGHLHAHEIMLKALLWSRICGAGFIKTTWDPTAGEGTEVLVSASTRQVLTDAQGAPMHGRMLPQAQQQAQSLGLDPSSVRAKKVNIGDVCLEAKSPFQMFPDPLADTFDECEWVIEECVKSREYVRQRFDVDLTPDTPANPGMVEVKMGSFIPGASPYKGIKLREFWAKPSSKYPNGKRCVWAQGQMLVEDNKPFDGLPYVMISSIPVPGRLWPTSIAEQLRGPQTELNKVRSQMAENRNRIGNPTLIASRQAIQDPEKFADSVSQPGGIAWSDNTIGPLNQQFMYLEAPAIPEYVVQEVATIQESIEAISGQHETTNAQVPPGVTAASAINLLQEADDTRLGPAVADYEHQLSKLGGKTLKLVSQFYTDQRTIRIAGDNGAWEIFDFKGAMLRDNCHVQVQTGSAFPHSKAAKQAALQEWLTFFVQSGNPPHGRQLAQLIQDFDIGGIDRLIEQWTKDEQQINDENLKLSQGTPLNINDYDDDQEHVDGHTDFQKGAKYRGLPQQVQQIFDQHVGLHRQRLAQMAQQQLEHQMQLQGQVPPTLTAAALQDQHELSQMQGQLGVQQQAAQGSQQLQAAAQQQGLQQAQGEQQQRQAEEKHRMTLQQMQEQHRQKMQQSTEQHQANLQRMAQQQQAQQQAQSQQQRGGSNERRNA